MENKFFTINNKSFYADFFQTLKNICSDDPAKTHIYETIYYNATDKELVSTDGRCLMIWKTDIIEKNGITEDCFIRYEKSGIVTAYSIPEEKKFVDYKRVIPNNHDSYINYEVPTKYSYGKDAEKVFPAKIAGDLAEIGIRLNAAYIEKQKAIKSQIDIITFNKDQVNKDGFSVVCFRDKQDTVKIILMPFKHDPIEIHSMKELEEEKEKGSAA